MWNVCRWYGGLRAAMICQHATRGRDQAIVKALGTFVRDARGRYRRETHWRIHVHAGQAVGIVHRAGSAAIAFKVGWV